MFNHFKLNIRGSSHSDKIEFELKGFPEGMRLDRDAFDEFMARRSPGHGQGVSPRRESDHVVFRCGFTDDGFTDGTTIVGEISNEDVRAQDYTANRVVMRPGHADFGQWVESGRIPTGGGRNSGRLTVAYCAVGALCRQWLERRGVSIRTCLMSHAELEPGNSAGGTVSCQVSGLAAGLGGELFDGVDSALSQAVFAIPGVKGVRFGDRCETAKGSEYNDEYRVDKEKRIITATNHCGGVLGGRTTGMALELTVEFRPTPTIGIAQRSVNIETMTETDLKMTGRHDQCIAIRAVPVVEAVAALTLADLMLERETRHPRICLTLTGRTIEECLDQYRNQRYFTDLVEVRVDMLAPEERVKAGEIAYALAVPTVLTIRRRRDGGEFDGSEDERAEIFRKLLGESAKPFDYVDFEVDFRRDELVRLARSRGTRIIRSLHDFSGTAIDVLATCRQLRGDTDEIPKVAISVNSVEEAVKLLNGCSGEPGLKRIVCAMGRFGQITRILAARTRSLWTYASVGGVAALGHLTPYELVHHRLRTTSGEAKLYGVTGWPLMVTRSPELHNGMFDDEGRDALMVAMPTPTAESAVAIMRQLHLRGMAVTIPHKVSIIALLDEISEEARTIGAVNTVVETNGRLIGYNTDHEGFTVALREFLPATDFTGMKAAVLGAGGAAKAVVYALNRLGAEAEIFHRRPLVGEFALIVNATPTDPIPEYDFSGRESVFDLRYDPEETPLMKRAKAAGCRVTNGLKMLIAQARAQQRLWK